MTRKTEETKEKTEARIQQEIVLWLREHGIFCHSVPNEAQGRSGIAQAKLVGMGLSAGVADLIVWWEDGIGYLEIKDSKGKQSARQKTFESLCLKHGISYELARSVEDLQEMHKRHINGSKSRDGEIIPLVSKNKPQGKETAENG